MAAKTRSKEDIVDEAQAKVLASALERSGLCVRRENLARGRAYRVKSGDCNFANQKLLFVDKRLPLKQQISVLVDYVVDYKISLEEDERNKLSPKTRSLIQPSA